MKKLFLIMLAFAFSLNIAIADDHTQVNDEKKDEVNSIFGNLKGKGKLYLAFAPKVTQINEELGILAGGRVGFTFDRTFTIGLAGSGLATQHNIKYLSSTDTAETRLHMGYGGLFLEYIHNSKDIMHFSANTLIGFGGLSLPKTSSLEYDYHWNMNDRDNTPWAAFFVIEPAVAVEFNITNRFRIGLEASYRYITNISENDLYKADTKLADLKLSGISGGLVFQWGWF